MSMFVRHIPEPRPGSRQHIFNLITDSTYRDNARSASFNIVPQGDGLGGRQGNGGRKWGYDAVLAPGTNERRRGEPDPGRYRFYRLITNNRTTWWVLTHTPGNTYKFNMLAIPRCRPCNGTSEIICPTCRGTRRVLATPDRLAGACPTCRNSPTSALPCPGCTPNPVIVDGYSIDKVLANW